MKRLLDIILLTIFSIHFLGNVLINIIGVPLAAYHSYEAWQEAEIINDSLKGQKKITKTERKSEHKKADTIQSIKNTHETKKQNHNH
ncbi:hypothetical protein DIS18_03355 [Algibacter marinivivus]|uniref:2TM domain-containing protein n=1 Tax=Algibacter marinivivus TaxID=2100723 RepID=A0A2U2X768_9FLAO|nr:hypothetical protein [Algibacter marinivivus]PWH83604.1 hypothetical protein DIS18_03355 [Algibacter marinivivus]